MHVWSLPAWKKSVACRSWAGCCCGAFGLWMRELFFVAYDVLERGFGEERMGVSDYYCGAWRGGLERRGWGWVIITAGLLHLFGWVVKRHRECPCRRREVDFKVASRRLASCCTRNIIEAFYLVQNTAAFEAVLPCVSLCLGGWITDLHVFVYIATILLYKISRFDTRI